MYSNYPNSPKMPAQGVSPFDKTSFRAGHYTFHRNVHRRFSLWDAHARWHTGDGKIAEEVTRVLS